MRDKRYRPFFCSLFAVLLIAGCGSEDENDVSSGPSRTPSSSDSGSAASSGDSEEAVSTEPGLLVGRIRFDGEIPSPRPLDVSGDDTESCHAAAEAGSVQDVVVSDDGGLASVVVEVLRLPEPEGGWDWGETASAVLRQEGCLFQFEGEQYAPSLHVVRDGGKLVVHNDDPVAHNINSRLWNRGQSSNDAPMELDVARRGGDSLLEIACNYHAWMKGWVYIASSPKFAVTGADGTFRIEGIPAGEHRIQMVHPTLGTQRMKVVIRGGEETDLAVTYPAD